MFGCQENANGRDSDGRTAEAGEHHKMQKIFENDRRYFRENKSGNSCYFTRMIWSCIAVMGVGLGKRMEMQTTKKIGILCCWKAT